VRRLRLLRCSAPAAVSRPGESEGEFRARLRDELRARRDEDVEKLRTRYAPELARLRERIAQAEQRIEREQAEYGQRKVQAAISIGATVVGALFGRKLGSVGNVGRATTAARGVGRAADERSDVARAAERAEDLRAKLAELERALAADLARIESPAAPTALALEEVRVAPRKADLEVKPLVLVWSPERAGP
jgi:carboxylesterase type B